MITRIVADNFKSFKHFDIKLDKFNVFIGPNASGKSNFLSLLQFISDFQNMGFENAVSIQGGGAYLKYLNAKEKNIRIQIYYNNRIHIPIISRKTQKITNISSIDNLYEINIEYSGNRIKNYSEKLTLKGLLKDRGKYIPIEITNKKHKINFDIQGKQEYEAIPTILMNNFVFKDKSIADSIGRIGIYDFDPGLSRKAIPINAKYDFESDGSNLTLILKNIMENKNEKKELISIINSILSYIKDIQIENLSDKSIMFKNKEEFGDNKFIIPSSFMSSGTANVYSIIIAIFFSKNNIIAIEEPEKGMHINLISRIIELMVEASNKKQIIITTHNSEILKFSPRKSLFLFSRDNDGSSKIVKPIEIKEIRTFLNDEMGIDMSVLLEDGFLN